MISRKTARAIAEATERCFGSYKRSSVSQGGYAYDLQKNRMYDFFYDHDYESWFLNAVKNLSNSSRGTTEWIMKLHTGESLQSATPSWDWKQRQNLGQRLLRDIAEDLLGTDSSFRSKIWSHEEFDKSLRTARAQLETDGYLWRDNKLLYSEAAVFDEADEAGVLQQLIEDVGLANAVVVTHHLDLADQHFVDGRWDDSIANARKVLEAVLQNTAAKHHIRTTAREIDPALFNSPVRTRDYLETAGLLAGKEKEAISKVYGLLSETGGHPYIAEKDQARLMRHLSLTFAQFALLRLQAFLRSV